MAGRFPLRPSISQVPKKSTLSLGEGKWLSSKISELCCQSYGVQQLNYVEVAPGNWSLHHPPESQTLNESEANVPNTAFGQCIRREQILPPAWTGLGSLGASIPALHSKYGELGTTDDVST